MKKIFISALMAVSALCSSAENYVLFSGDALKEGETQVGLEDFSLWNGFTKSDYTTDATAPDGKSMTFTVTAAGEASGWCGGGWRNTADFDLSLLKADGMNLVFYAKAKGDTSWKWQFNNQSKNVSDQLPFPIKRDEQWHKVCINLKENYGNVVNSLGQSDQGWLYTIVGYQLKEGDYIAVTDVHFEVNPEVEVDPDYMAGNTWYSSTTAVAVRDGKEYNISIDYSLTATDQGQLTCVATVKGNEGLDNGTKLHVVTPGVTFEQWMNLAYDAAQGVYSGTTTNSTPFKWGSDFAQLHFWLEYPGGVVGPQVQGYLFGAKNEAPKTDPYVTLKAEASNVTSDGATIKYTLKTSNHFTADNVKVYLGEEVVTANPVVLTGLTADTEYTYKLRAVGTYEGTEYASEEVTVSFKTFPEGVSGRRWCGIADGFLKNALYEGEDESMRRDIPVSINVETIWNPDKTMTFNVSVASAAEVLGLQVPGIVAVSNANTPGSPDHVAMKGDAKSATFTTTNIYNEGENMEWFTFDLTYNGGTTNIGSLRNAFTVGQENSVVKPGAPAAVDFRLTAEYFRVGDAKPFTCAVTDAAGHFVFNVVPTYEVKGSQFVVEGNTVKAVATGSCDLVVTCGEVSKTVTLNCSLSANAQLLTPAATYADAALDNASLLFDGNDDTMARWDCGGSSEHYIIVDLGAMRNLNVVDLVWEGAMAVKYTVTLSRTAPAEVPAVNTLLAGPARAGAVNNGGDYEFVVTDGANLGGTIPRSHVVSGSGFNAQYVALRTTEAVNPEWGIKLREMRMIGEPEASGVESVAAESADAPVEYFTVGGVRISGDLTPGLYIRRQGNTVTKVTVK